MYKIVQLPSQSTDDFIQKIEIEGLRIRAEPSAIRQAVLSGLRPEILQCVVQHDINPDNLDDIRKWGRIKEEFTTSSPTTATISKLLAEQTIAFESKINDVLLKLESASLRGVPAPQTGSTATGVNVVGSPHQSMTCDEMVELIQQTIQRFQHEGSYADEVKY